MYEKLLKDSVIDSPTNGSTVPLPLHTGVNSSALGLTLYIYYYNDTWETQLLHWFPFVSVNEKSEGKTTKTNSSSILLYQLLLENNDYSFFLILSSEFQHQTAMKKTNDSRKPEQKNMFL